MSELKEAEKKAQPGDIIVLKNGEWKDVTIKLNCKGSKEKPIKFKAETGGKVIITGNSQLRIGGEYIIVEGLLFTSGYAGDDPVISFRSDKDELANNCRVTNCAIDNFNNPKRMEENYWVAFYGKKNELDHCSFRGKTNMGVLLAVILDDDRSRENFHLIDHNYFGKRVPLASNGGEIIRVGVSQHCQFNSNTTISNNFFEHCDGETEIISIKSCSNHVEQNVFKECQGSVVLRHGDNNLVAGNYFLGNDKTGTGGVRIINKGQAVISNIFYKCRGIDFRSPMAIMNGIPNSPANRYVQVTDAQVMSNTFYECSPIALCEGSDAERTLPPDNVRFEDNTFYNTHDTTIYRAFDDISGFHFAQNKVSSQVKQGLGNGFIKTNLLSRMSFTKKTGKSPEYPHVDNIAKTEKETYLNSGASWFAKVFSSGHIKPYTVKCATANDIVIALDKKDNDITLLLTGTAYKAEKPLIISKTVRISADRKKTILFETGKMDGLFVIEGNGNLILENIILDGTGVKATNLIMNSKSGSSSHYNLTIRGCSFQKMDRANGCENFFFAYKSMVADSIVIRNSSFYDNIANTFIMADEKDDKGYYNAEKIILNNNSFSDQQGTLVNIYRGGNDESTMGPNLSFANNKLINCNTSNTTPLISFMGVQFTNVASNIFNNCNTGSTLLQYKDTVRAKHLFEKNTLIHSGQLEKDQFLVERSNNVQ